MIISHLIRILILLPVVLTALLETKSCRGMNSTFKLSKPLLDVALDDKNKLLKFFINTKVIDPYNMTNILPVIDDVNDTTNRYTTFHATIYFMGQQIIDENKRFCDMLGVKNTTQYLQSPRFYQHTKPNTTIVVDPSGPIEVSNGFSRPQKRGRYEDVDESDGADGEDEGIKVIEDANSHVKFNHGTNNIYYDISFDSDLSHGHVMQNKLVKYDDEEGEQEEGEEEGSDGPDTGQVAAVDPAPAEEPPELDDTSGDQGSAPDPPPAVVIPADPNDAAPVIPANPSPPPPGAPVVPADPAPPSILLPNTASASSTMTGPIVSTYAIPTDSPVRDPNLTSFAKSNDTIESLFSNSTGNLIGCPLYVNDSIYIYYEVDISQHYGKIGSFSARFAVVSNSEDNALLTCSRVYITPTVIRSIQRAILYGALALLVATAVINFLTVMYSSYQESQNPFLFTASTICNAKLLKQLDATIQRIVLYLQFALFTAGLSLNYPGFYQPLIALLKWCALLGFSVLTGNEFFSSTEQDNIYLTYNANGLNSLSYYGSYKTSGQNWWNFILSLTILILLQFIIQILYFSFKFLRKKSIKRILHDSSLKATLLRAGSLSLGIALSNFMIIFGYPFLVLTLYLFQLAAQNKKEFTPSVAALKYNAFSRNVSYDSLFNPMTYIKFKHPGSNGTTTIELSNDFIQQGYNITTTNSTANNFTVVNSYDGVNLGPVVFGAILFAIWVALAAYFIFGFLISFKKWGLALNHHVSKLYTSVNTVLCWGFLYHHYNPSKNYYVIFELVNLLLKSVVVAIIQVSGVAQVILLIVLEFAMLVSMILMKPFFLDMSWTTTRWMIPVARFLVMVLCIPFIPSLNYSEKIRTYVAFTHLIIHLIIALAFCGQLLYCFTMTIISVIKHRQKDYEATLNEKLTQSASVDDFNKQFEYRPIEHLLMPIAPVHPEPEPRRYSSSLYHDDVSDASSDKFDLSNPDFYYRRNMTHDSRGIERTIVDNVSILSDGSSFRRQQEFSDERKKQNDYTTREADKIYKKYFVDDNIDEDMRQLWESRIKNRESRENLEIASKNHIRHLTMPLIKKFKKDPRDSGFHVSRPRPLIVKQAPRSAAISVSSSSIDDDTAVVDTVIDRKGSTKTTKTSATLRTESEVSVYEDAQSSIISSD